MGESHVTQLSQMVTPKGTPYWRVSCWACHWARVGIVEQEDYLRALGQEHECDFSGRFSEKQNPDPESVTWDA